MTSAALSNQSVFKCWLPPTVMTLDPNLSIQRAIPSGHLVLFEEYHKNVTPTLGSYLPSKWMDEFFEVKPGYHRLHWLFTGISRAPHSTPMVCEDPFLTEHVWRLRDWHHRQLFVVCKCQANVKQMSNKAVVYPVVVDIYSKSSNHGPIWSTRFLEVIDDQEMTHFGRNQTYERFCCCCGDIIAGWSHNSRFILWITKRRMVLFGSWTSWRNKNPGFQTLIVDELMKQTGPGRAKHPEGSSCS